jgi:hypothetical protein
MEASLDAVGSLDWLVKDGGGAIVSLMEQDKTLLS